MHYLRRIFSLDLRSIALFRIMLGSLLLLDLILRSADLRIFYTDEGILPRQTWLDLTHKWHWSIHAASGELWWQLVLFCLAALAAIALIAGYRSKLAALVSFVLLASLISRNNLLLQGGDILLLVLAFWSLFLPLGARYAFDAALQSEHASNPNAVAGHSQNEQRYFSVATVAIVLQVLYLYFFTALLKTGDAWVVRFDAAFYALSLQQFATPIGHFMTQFPGFLKLATFYVLTVEFLAPLLVLCPFFWPYLRLLGLLLLTSLHIGFLLMMHIGIFPLIDFAALSLLIPGAVWVAVDGSRRQQTKRKHLENIRIYYDEDCGFCLKMCLILRMFLLPATVPILRAQNVSAIHAIMERENSWVIEAPDGKTYTHWHAMAYLFRQRWPFKPLGWLMAAQPFLAIGNRIYRLIADNRGSMGNWSSRTLPFKPVNRQPTVAGAVIAALFFYVVTVFNWYQLPDRSGSIPKHVDYLARVTRLNQRWDMFAPFPLTLSRYPVVPGTLRNGDIVQLFPSTSNEPDWQEPERFYPLFDSYRWRKYMGRVDSHRNNKIRSALGRYYCTYWNSQKRSRDTQLATLKIQFVKYRTNTNGTPKERIDRTAWRHWCFEEFADK